DAGTPVISDPGFAIAAAAIEAGFKVDAIPGPCALIQALVLSGLPADKFAFEGFLPRNKEGLNYLKSIAQEERTLIFYEAPHRLRQSLNYLQEAFGENRKAAVCRELTKKFQEVNRGSLSELNLLWQEREPQGEYVLVVEGAKANKGAQTYTEEFLTAELARLLAGGMKHKAAAKELGLRYGLPVSKLYELGLKLKKS
ncbi:MAG: 16S rRNA (cytidine(1402)-2'-O)-methyltransferase, partial [Clostridia bacterium]|nr:16S rRNA (cytidine(1402)-2'-O)-methyltransferase [Clostridia bacterium]